MKQIPQMLHFLQTVLDDLLPYAEISEECGKLSRKVWGNRTFVAELLNFVDQSDEQVVCAALKLLLSFLNRSPATFRHDGLFILAQKVFPIVCRISEEGACNGFEELTLYAIRVVSLLSCSRLIYSDRMILTGPLFEAVTGGGGKEKLCGHLFKAVEYCSTFDDLKFAKEVYVLGVECIGNLCTAHTQTVAKGTLAAEGQSSRLLHHLLDVLYLALPQAEDSTYTYYLSDPTALEMEPSDNVAPLVDRSRSPNFSECLLKTPPGQSLHSTSTSNSQPCMSTTSYSSACGHASSGTNATQGPGPLFTYTGASMPVSHCAAASPTSDEGTAPSASAYSSHSSSTLTPRVNASKVSQKDDEQLTHNTGTGTSSSSTKVYTRMPRFSSNALLHRLSEHDCAEMLYLTASLLVEYLRNADLIPVASDVRPAMNKPTKLDKPKPMLEKCIDSKHWDYIISAQDEEVKVQKCILAAYVPYFCSLFEHQPQSERTEFPESIEIVRIWVRYVYTFDDSLIANMDIASGLLRIADRLCQDILLRDCEIFLYNSLDRHNLYFLFGLAAQCNATSLLAACATFALRLLPERLSRNTMGIWWLRGQSMLTSHGPQNPIVEIPYLPLILDHAHDLVQNFFKKDVDEKTEGNGEKRKKERI